MKGDALERYVQSATRGLYGKKRTQVTRELRGNLEHRMNEFMSFGDSREKAVERALLEFGAAGVVSRGLQEVYIMPILNKWAAAAGLLGIMTFLSLSATASGVQYTLEAPVPVCERSLAGPLKANSCALRGASWLELESLLETLKKQGVKIERTTTKGVASQIKLLFPGQTQPSVVQTLSDRSAHNPMNFELSRFERGGKLFVNTTQFLQALGESRVPLTVSNLKNPKLNISGVKLELGDTKHPVNIQVALERLVIGRALSSPFVLSKESEAGSFEIPQMTGIFGNFRYFWPTSGKVRDTQVLPVPITLKLPQGTQRLYLLLTRTSTLEKGQIVPALDMELLERQPDDTLSSRSYLFNGKFVRNIGALYTSDDQGTGLLWPVHLEKPSSLLDTKNPVVLRSSDITF